MEEERGGRREEEGVPRDFRMSTDATGLLWSEDRGLINVVSGGVPPLSPPANGDWEEGVSRTLFLQSSNGLLHTPTSLLTLHPTHNQYEKH